MPAGGQLLRSGNLIHLTEAERECYMLFVPSGSTTPNTVELYNKQLKEAIINWKFHDTPSHQIMAALAAAIMIKD